MSITRIIERSDRLTQIMFKKWLDEWYEWHNIPKKPGKNTTVKEDSDNTQSTQTSLVGDEG